MFVASVVWLLFDMAALRLSINDVNSRILKERVIRERELLRQQSAAARRTKGGPKHPLQRVNLALSPAGREAQEGVKLAQVYRQKEKKEEQKTEEKERRSIELRGRNFSQASQPNTLPPGHKDASILQMSTPEKDVTIRNNADLFDVNGITREKRLETDAAEKQNLPLVSSVQENKEPSLTWSEKEPPEGQNGGQNTPTNTAPRATDAAKDGPKEAKGGRGETRPAQTGPGPPNQDSDRNTANMETEQGRVAASRHLTPAGAAGRPAVGPQPGSPPNSTAVRKAGVHRVQHLDATLVPRDAKAVGQFGQAVLVSSSEDAQVRERWDEGFFNVYLSDRIPVDRAVPDTRPER